jgi:hypothetical protein
MGAIKIRVDDFGTVTSIFYRFRQNQPGRGKFLKRINEIEMHVQDTDIRSSLV